jgi:hypothetical protein
VSSPCADAEPADTAEPDVLGFIRALHLSPLASFPTPGQTDWSRAPPFLPQRLGATLIELPGAEPPWQGRFGEEEAFSRLGAWLAMSLMCHRTRFDPAAAGSVPAARRALASGGAAYPADLYLRFGIGWAAVSPLLPRHAWLYLPHHHALAAHDEADPLAAAEGVEATLVTVLSRTAFKYREFAYRLSAVDTGLALGRLLAAARACGAKVAAKCSRGDEGLALVEPEEQAAARLVCSMGVPIAAQAREQPERLALRVEAGHGTRLRAISAGQPAVFAALGLASSPNPPVPPPRQAAVPALERIPLPAPAEPLSAGFPAAVHARRSQAPGFSGVPAPLSALASCLRSAEAALGGLGAFAVDASVRLGCTAIAVADREPFTGVFDRETGSIAVTGRGSAADRLGRAMLIRSFDMRQCSFVLHVLADFERPCLVAGAAGYRRSQIAVGAMLDAATMAAVDARLSAHAFLGFSAPDIGPLYGLEPNGSLQPVAQLCIGHPRPGLQWETAIVG